MTFFNILVPTRERADTLFWTLKTLLVQDYSDYKIIVSDNCSEDNTEEVVKSFNSERIEYHRTPERLSMTGNFEYALSLVTKGYVTVIGDDDSILPNTLSEINSIINQHKVKAIAWHPAKYIWATVKDKSLNGLLSVPLRSTYEILNSKNEFEKISTDIFRTNYLPSVYWSFIEINTMKKCFINGTFFHSFIPDTYSGVAIASKLENYLYSKKPYSISGSSHHSNALGFFNKHINQESNKRFLSENNLQIHPKIMLAPSATILLLEPTLQAFEKFNILPKLNIKKIISQGFYEAANCDSKEKFDEIKSALVSIGKGFGLTLFVKRLNKNVFYNGTITQQQKGGEITNDELFIDSTKLNLEFGKIENVYDASIFIQLFLNKNKLVNSQL